MDFNLSMVEVGMKFSTLSKLYKILGVEKIPEGKAKELLNKELLRYLSYKKTGKISRGKETNEIVITEIYPTPLEKEDKRKTNNKGNNSKYLPILKKLLSQRNYCGTMYDIITDIYGIGEKDIIYPLKNNPYYMNEYIRKMKRLLQERTELALSKLSQEGILTYTQCRLVVMVKDIKENPESRPRQATLEEDLLISQTEIELLYKLNYESWGDLFAHGDKVIFFKKLEEELSKRGVVKQYKTYSINLLTDREVNKDELTEAKEQLRTLVEEKMWGFMNTSIAKTDKVYLVDDKGYCLNTMTLEEIDPSLLFPFLNDKVITRHNNIFNVKRAMIKPPSSQEKENAI